MRLRAAKGPIQAYDHTEHFLTFPNPGCLLGERSAQEEGILLSFCLGHTQGG